MIQYFQIKNPQTWQTVIYFLSQILYNSWASIAALIKGEKIWFSNTTQLCLAMHKYTW